MASAPKTTEFSVVSRFLNYRSREDITNLPPGVLIVGSKNVLTNVSERVQIRQGYSVDGQVSDVASPVLSSFDWLTRGNNEKHMRAGGSTDGTDGRLQYRYSAEGGEVDELITNGTFTGNDNGWTVGADWSYGSNDEDFTTASGTLVPGLFGINPSFRGTGYVVGDVLTLTGGGNDATVTVASISGSGEVQALTLTTIGSGYDASTDYAVTGGSGTGAQVTVSVVAGTPLFQSVETQQYITYTVTATATVSNPTEIGVFRGSAFDETVEYLGASSGGGTFTFDFVGNGTTNLYIVPLLSSVGPVNGTLDTVSLIHTHTAGEITWRDLMTDLTSVAFNFTTFWRIDENLRVALFVDGSSNVYEWNGATAVVSGTTVNTITKTGTDSWLDSGFYSSGNKVVTINGTDYTYTGGENTTTLTGVTPDPSVEPQGGVVVQKVITTAISSFTDGPPSTFPAGLIRVLNNQIFLGSLTSSVLWISKVNDYKDYGSSTPRQSGEGATLILDSQLVALIPQENFMYVSAGQDLWYNVNFELQTSTVGVTYEQVNALPLKTGRQQGARSQGFTSHMKNDIIVVTNEPTVDTFGRIESSLATPQTTNISDPIKLDMDGYDFTDGSIFYWRYYILVAVPKNGVVLVFNLASGGWEAPQTLPISRFYIVDGELYGHSYNTFESYKLFTGYADRVYPGFTGFPIQADWVFSYQNYGSRFSLKSSTKMYVEGYINANTTLTARITYELDGCKTVKSFELDGDDSQFVCLATSGGSLGKSSLGKEKLGGDDAASIQGLPPKFRWFPTFQNTDFFENSVSFSVLGTDNRAEFLAFGLAVTSSTQIPTQKMD